MSVDVRTETVIDVEPERWPRSLATRAARRSGTPTSAPWSFGSRMAFVASFLGRRLACTYEVVELVPGERLVMRTAQGPFPMETTYTWEPAGPGRTRMVLRNAGEPAGFGRVAAPVLAAAMRRANEKDLAALTALVERGA